MAEQTYDVWVVAKDQGGTNNVVPVADYLGQAGIGVLPVANGKAVELLQGRAGVFNARTADEVLARYPLPKVLVSSMCSEGGVGRDLAISLRGRVKTVAVQDFWGARLWTVWSDPRCWSDYITVNDGVGAKIVDDAWRGYDRRRVRITGYPHLDSFASFDVRGTAAKTRSTLGLGDDRPIVLFGGQVKASGEMLAECVEALNEIGTPVVLMPRQHGRMQKDAPEEVAKWERALTQFRSGTIESASGFSDIRPLLATATVVVSAFSSILVEAATIGKPVISMLYPEVGMKRFYEETGGGVKEFPLVELGCAAKATNRKELIGLLNMAFRGGLGLEVNQRRTFRLDGKNTQRVAEVVTKLVRGEVPV